MKLSLRFVLILSLIALTLSACAASAGNPADVVEQYLTAMAEGDADAMAVASCADWEVDARETADSFIAVETTLNNLSCETVTETDTDALVACTGSLAVSYEGEQTRDIDLSIFVYQLVKEGGNWLVCKVE